MELAQIAPLIPQAGVAGILIAVIGVLLRQNHQDRSQYRADVARIEARAAEDAAEAREKHMADLAEVRDELRGLRKELKQSMEETEEERRKRWHAEDSASEYRRRLQALGETVEP